MTVATPARPGADFAVVPSRASLAQARDQVRQTVAGHIADVLVEDCVLLTSEVVADALGGGTERVSVSVRVQDDGVRVDVTDRGHSVANDVALFRTAVHEPCRMLLEGLSAQWGIAPFPFLRGRTVWFEMPRATCRM